MDKNNAKLRDAIIERSKVNPLKCMKCGKCSGTCPSYDEMEYHPHQFVYMVETGNIEPLMKSESLYKCLTCFACVDRCPREVEPAKIIEAIRLEAVRKQNGDRLSTDKIPELLDEDMPQQLLVTALRKYKK